MTTTTNVRPSAAAARAAMCGRSASSVRLWAGAAAAITLCAAGAVMVALLGGCEQETADPQPVVDRVDPMYTTRGRVVSLPAADEPRSTFAIHHEEVPGFLHANGEPGGMAEMTMPFDTLADGVELSGLEVGDAIEFDWIVTWLEGGEPRWAIHAIRPLGEDAALDLAGESPPSSSDVEAHAIEADTTGGDVTDGDVTDSDVTGSDDAG